MFFYNLLQVVNYCYNRWVLQISARQKDYVNQVIEDIEKEEKQKNRMSHIVKIILTIAKFI